MPLGALTKRELATDPSLVALPSVRCAIAVRPWTWTLETANFGTEPVGFDPEKIRLSPRWQVSLGRPAYALVRSWDTSSVAVADQ